jgi:hypothetical protein
VLFQAGRERTKTNAVKLIHEARMALHTIGNRLVAEGLCDDVGDFGFLLADEVEAWLDDPARSRTRFAAVTPFMTSMRGCKNRSSSTASNRTHRPGRVGARRRSSRCRQATC